MLLLLTAECGFLALLIYITIIFFSWKNYLEAEKMSREKGDIEIELITIALQCGLLSYLIIGQTQPLGFPLGLMLLYSLSAAIKQNILLEGETRAS